MAQTDDNMQTPRISYEPEADVVRIEMSDLPIDYAKEMGNIVVHFSPDNVPVYVEILQATKFRKKFLKVFERPTVAHPFAV